VRHRAVMNAWAVCVFCSCVSVSEAVRTCHYDCPLFRSVLIFSTPPL